MSAGCSWKQMDVLGRAGGPSAGEGDLRKEEMVVWEQAEKRWPSNRSSLTPTHSTVTVTNPTYTSFDSQPPPASLPDINVGCLLKSGNRKFRNSSGAMGLAGKGRKATERGSPGPSPSPHLLGTWLWQPSCCTHRRQRGQIPTLILRCSRAR